MTKYSQTLGDGLSKLLIIKPAQSVYRVMTMPVSTATHEFNRESKWWDQRQAIAKSTGEKGGKEGSKLKR